MKTYTINISESQRAYIEKTLRAYEAAHGVPRNEFDLEVLTEQITEIPDVPVRDGTVHGLCWGSN